MSQGASSKQPQFTKPVAQELAPAETTGAGFRTHVRGSLRRKLTVSHVLVVTLSTFIYASGGFVIFLLLLRYQGYSRSDIVGQWTTIASLTVFVLVNIFLITICGLVAASLVSWNLARRLTRQIDELESVTEEFARGQLSRRAAVFTDDELGRLAERFNLLAERLETLDSQRRAFVGNISHDLRTPIAIIRGHLDAQERQATDPEGSTASDAYVSPGDAFRSIGHETQTLSSLIDDLFTLSRLEEDALPIELSPVDIGELIEDAVLGIRPYALRLSRVSVNARVPPELPRVLGDATKITQIINNLVHNAVRHTPAGGVVIVSTEAKPALAMVEVTVQDTGVGIAPEDLPHIFERFYQGESTRAPGGTGLGLSIVKQLVEAQGGVVAAASQLGEGTTISFRLPMVGNAGMSTRRSDDAVSRS